MCWRYTLRTPASNLISLFSLLKAPELAPRFNVAPTQDVPVVVEDPDRELKMMRWGLVPSWAKELKIGNRMINARGETAATKPSFRAAWKRRRCLIPCDGFYEWKKQSGSRVKQPYLISRADNHTFAFAGLWETWKPEADADPVFSCTIITTEANELMSEVHDRMPVILADADYSGWLSSQTDVEDLQGFIRPFPDDELQLTPVSTRINNARNEYPEITSISDLDVE